MSTARALRMRHLRRELARSPGVSAAIVAMILLGACLMASGAMVMERLVGAIDELFEQARPPHFLQMHKGDYDVDALERFAGEHPEIESWFIEEMVGFAGAAISWQRPTTGEAGDLSDSLIDHLFVSQSPEFDLLTGLDGGVPQPASGEVHVPVAIMDQYGLQEGDLLRVATTSGVHELTVAGFIRDAQMASSLAASTRFLVSEQDLGALTAAGGGAPEIIVEYRLTSSALATDLEQAYTSDPTLPMNGEAVTFTMVWLLHAIGYGLAAIALMFVALVLVAIALLNVRFTIRSRLEDSVTQIGAMKAIGLPDREIARLYLGSYAVLTLVGCGLGGALALVAVPLLTRDVELSYAATGFGTSSLIVLLLALAVVALVVIGSCHRALGRLRKVPVVDALVHGSLLDARRAARRDRRRARRAGRSGLRRAAATAVNSRIALIDLRADMRQWVLVPIVFCLAAVLMALPAHLLSTLSSPRFVTYMGAPDADVLVDLQHTDGLDRLRAELAAAMQEDERLSEVQQFARVLAQVQAPDGWQAMQIEVGDYSGSTIEYEQGTPPQAGEIALSVLNADELGLAPGDTLVVRVEGDARTAVVSGVYVDVTSAGYTAKMDGVPGPGASAYVLYADVRDGTDPAALAAEYHERFPAAEVVPMREYAEQTMGYMTGAVRNTAVLAGVFGLAIAALITAMFLQLRLSRERRAMWVMSAIGFSTAEITAQVRGKTLVGVVCGTLLGTIAALVLGGPAIGGLMSATGLGLSSLQLLPDPVLTALIPVLLAAAGIAATVAATARLRRVDGRAWLRP